MHTDNTPAVWLFSRAYEQNCMSYQELKDMVLNREFPIAFALSKGEREKATYKRTMSEDLNQQGWKLCHMESVGDRREKIDSMALDEFQARFIRFLQPSNMFLIPKVWSGLGELPEVINAVKRSIKNEE